MTQLQRAAMVCAWLMCVAPLASADIIRVPGDHTTLQQAIDASQDGDTILVDDGIYRGSGNRDLDFSGRAVSLIAENGPSGCIIDCEGMGRGFQFISGEGPDTLVQGLTLRNGFTAADGGGVYSEDSAPTLAGIVIEDCEAQGNGGAVYCTGPGPSPRIVFSIFSDNTADNNGGGIALADGAGPKMINNLFTGNSAGQNGGAVACLSGSPSLNFNTIAYNMAGVSGGGLYTEGAEPFINNSIVWYCGDNPIHLVSGNIRVRYSNVEGGWPGAGNIHLDPLLDAGPRGGGYLDPSSPCVDAGGVPSGETSIPMPGGPLALDTLVCENSQMLDTGTADMGYHRLPRTITADLGCSPDSGTLPFFVNLCAAVNNVVDFPRQVSGSVNITLPGGAEFNGLRGGDAMLGPVENFQLCWNQYLPAYPSLLGQIVFDLVIEDVTTGRYSESPFPPAGDRGMAACTIMALPPSTE